jgi:hypothetical protein
VVHGRSGRGNRFYSSILSPFRLNFRALAEKPRAHEYPGTSNTRRIRHPTAPFPNQHKRNATPNPDQITRRGASPTCHSEPDGGEAAISSSGVLVSPQKRQPGSQTPTSRRPSMNRQPVKREGNQRSGNHGRASPSSRYGQEGDQPPGNQGGASRPSSYSMPAVAASARRSCL